MYRYPGGLDVDRAYSVAVHMTVYGEWPSYVEILVRYPEVIGISEFDMDTGCRVYTFESIEHYHWFLLKVM